jgi:hypothetical protein
MPEKEPQIFPKINLFPRLVKVGEFILDHLPTQLPKQPLARGDHTFERPTEPPVLPEQLYSE